MGKSENDAVASATDMIASVRQIARGLSGHVAVGGALCPALSKATFAVENPGDGTEIAQAARCAAPDVERAVSAAQRAFAGWAAVPARERGRLVGLIADRIEAEREPLARLLCLETGNALVTQARPEVTTTIDTLRFFAGLGGELKGRTVPWEDGTLMYTTRDPLGVVGAIIPWNAPLFLMASKIAPALVAGNAVVLKTAEQAPLTVLRATQLFQDLLPAGAVNVISGFGEEAGKPLAEHPLVRKISFTGSEPVGRMILGYAAQKICPVTLELGGKSPNIVLADANLDRAVPGIIAGMRFSRQGQSCSAGTRLFLHEAVYDEVMERVVVEARKLRVGVPMDERTDIGAIISAEQLERVRRYVELARATPGARIRCGGESPADPGLRKGYFFEPTLIEGLPHDAAPCQDEIFGPVAIAFRWKDFDEVLATANDTSFGLAAAIWTRDIERGLAFASRIQAGFVQVNQYLTPRANVAYGGLKHSGLGKELSLESMLEHFTSSKTVIVNFKS